jgi:fumarylacetoacetase
LTKLNFTHDPARTSWVESAAAGSQFPIQNLPFGVFRQPNGMARGGVAIGDMVLDLAAARAAGLFEGAVAEVAAAASGETLNPLLEMGNAAASILRARLSEILVSGSPDMKTAAGCLVPMAGAELLMPVAVRQFTDMSVSSFHMGRSRGNDENGDPNVRPLFKYQPIGYNGRASSVVVSGTALHRPWGQWMPNGVDDDGEPEFGPEPRQDYELEFGVWIGGKPNPLGRPVSVREATDRIFGLCLLNDWSSRRIQVRESILGPFLSKSMGTTISPWIVTAEALAPFRIPMFTRPASAPALLPHLDDPADQASGGFDIDILAEVSSARSRSEGSSRATICESNARYLYWSFAQIIAHHTTAGCDLAPGDLIGSGTCSGPAMEQAACLSEKTRGATIKWSLPNGEERAYLEDGDSVHCSAMARRDGQVPIGFGACDGELLPAVSLT